MNNGGTGTGTGETERCTDHVTSRAFLAAHLLTANVEQAESAVMEAIAACGPDDRCEETLFERVLNIAVRRQPSGVPDSSASYLPPELQAALRLSPQLRRCFVLRILVGLSRQTCARLLHWDSRRVDQYTSAALEVLPFLAARPNAEVEYLVWKKRLD